MLPSVVRSLRTLIPFIALILIFTVATQCDAAKMIGYWVPDSNLPLSGVSSDFDIIVVSNGVPTGVDNATMVFDPSPESVTQLQSDIQGQQSQGKKVLIQLESSVSGPPRLALLTNADVTSFVTSVEGLVDLYHFDGIDIDFEDGVLAVDPGDNDIYHPTTPTIKNLIAAMHTIKSHYGSNFMITTPSESEAVNSYYFWGNDIHIGWVSNWGGAIPFLIGIRDILNYVWPMEYLSASAPYDGLDGVVYSPSTDPRDFFTSQMELMIRGYTLCTGENFPGLPSSEVALGLYESNPQDALASLEYIGSGTSYSGSYDLIDPSGYPTFGGAMEYDVNWDQEDNNLALAGTLAPYLHSIGAPAGGSTAPSAPTNLTSTSAHEVIKLAWTASTGATSYTVSRSTNANGSGAVVIASGLTDNEYTDFGLTAGTTYYYTVTASNSHGTSSASNQASAVFTLQLPYQGTPWPVPGTVDIDNYDTGGAGFGYYSGSTTTNAGGQYRSDGVDIETCSDSSPGGNGFDVTGTAAGQWLRYTINAASGGKYTFSFRVASASGGTFHLAAPNGTALTGPITVPATGGAQKWTTITASMQIPDPNIWFENIPQGKSIIELYEDTGGYSLEYMTFNATTPDTPAGLSATTDPADISLDWLPSDSSEKLQNDAATYNVYRGTSSGGESSTPVATGLTATALAGGGVYVDTQILAGTTYYYTVRGVNGAGTSAASNETSATAAGTTSPAPPTNLDASPGDAEVTLSWTPSVNGTNYNVYVGTTAGGESSTAVQSGVVGSQATVSNLTNGTTYYFVVNAVNSAGTSVASNEASTKPVSAGPPAAPTGLAATPGNGSVGLSWTAAGRATSYNVYMGISAGGESTTANQGGVTTTSATVTNLTNNTTYYFEVTAVNADGESTKSNEVSATPSGPPITQLIVKAPSTATTRQPVTVTVTAQTATGDTATWYTGTVHFTSTDAVAVLPGNAVLSQGTGTFQVTFNTAGSRTVTAADTQTSTLTGTSGSIAVTVGSMHSFSSGLQMISAPADFSGQTLAQIFNTGGVVLDVWEPANFAYAVSPNSPADTIRPGVGYWTDLSTASTLYDIGTHTNESQMFSIPLLAGWNMIGDPFAESVDIASVNVAAGSAQPVSFATAVDEGIVSNYIYTYPAGANAYQLASTLTPYQGYWLYAMHPCTLQLGAPGQ